MHTLTQECCSVNKRGKGKKSALYESKATLMDTHMFTFYPTLASCKHWCSAAEVKIERSLFTLPEATKISSLKEHLGLFPQL